MRWIAWSVTMLAGLTEERTCCDPVIDSLSRPIGEEE
jgi:hypothetical protein